ncbi:MAG: hypothetical protein OXR82_10130 [Gammaproteobacteria bacterium]|nr:hypothetical protein [Gammaproteobacteria bacterium]MDE0258726.1 hypothetical protein [Gammaproteobacteria bacterium]
MKLSQELIAILAVGAALMGLQFILFVSLRGDMASMETRLRGEMNDLRDEMRGEMNVLREDVRHDIDALRIDIQDIREDVRQLRDKLLVPAGGV